METNIYKKLFEVKKAGIKLQRDTKAFNYKYATLSQIQEKYADILEKQNLVVVHSVGNNCVVTEIVDIDCTEHNYRRVYSTIEMNKDTKPQDKGSEITYFRRYNLLSLLDLEVEDDDGKKAQDSKGGYAKAETPNKTNFTQNIMDYITRVREEKDINAIQPIIDEFNKHKWSEKQSNWFNKEAKEQREKLEGVDGPPF